LEVLDRIGSAAGEGYDVIPDVAGSCSGRQARRRAGMHLLELSRHCTRSMLARRSNAKGFQPNHASEHHLAQGRHQLSTSSLVRLNVIANRETITSGSENLHGSVASSSKRLDQSDRCNRPAKHTEHRRTPDFVARRQLRELAFDEIEIVCGLITAGATHNGSVGGMKE
jgi:hypothetical protein